MLLVSGSLLNFIGPFMWSCARETGRVETYNRILGLKCCSIFHGFYRRYTILLGVLNGSLQLSDVTNNQFRFNSKCMETLEK